MSDLVGNHNVGFPTRWLNFDDKMAPLFLVTIVGILLRGKIPLYIDHLMHLE